MSLRATERVVVAIVAYGQDADTPAPQPKTRFLMLQRDESLAELRTHYDETRSTLTIARGHETVLVADLGEPHGRAAVEDFFAGFIGALLRGRPRPPGRLTTCLDSARACTTR